MTEAMTGNAPITFTDEAVLRDPLPAYKWLRDNAPVYKDPVLGVYVVSRYEDIRTIVSDPASFSNNHGMYGARAHKADDEVARILKEGGARYLNTLVTADPPEHTGYRAIVQSAFGPARITKMHAYIQEVCDTLVDGFVDKGRCELVSELAIPMPMYIIADQLGIARDRYQDFKRWSDAMLIISDPGFPKDVHIACAHSLVEMQNYLRSMARQYRAVPADNVLSDVVAGEVDGRQLTDDEVISISGQIMAAGNETTTNTIALGLNLMIERGLEPVLRADLSRIPAFVEEVLRLTASLQGQYRRATRDIVLGGVEIPAGSPVMIRLAAANRDERRFDNPDEVDLERKQATQHLTFGMGIHYCLGNLLARAELRVAFTTLLTRLKNFRLADVSDNPQLILHQFARGFSKMEVEFDRA